MPYDPSKDKVIKAFPTVEIKEGEFIAVNVCSWNGGQPKVAFLHMYTNRDGETRTSGKIPRLTGEVAAQVARVMAEAAEFAKQCE